MYNYATERPFVFTEEGQVKFLEIRDRAKKLLSDAGAFNQESVTSGTGGDSWSIMACVDRLVELGEIVEVSRGEVAGQYRVFVSAGK